MSESDASFKESTVPDPNTNEDYNTSVSAVRIKNRVAFLVILQLLAVLISGILFDSPPLSKLGAPIPEPKTGHQFGFTKTDIAINQTVAKCSTTEENLILRYGELYFANASEYSFERKAERKAGKIFKILKNSKLWLTNLKKSVKKYSQFPWPTPQAKISTDPRIVGGGPTKIEEFPWQVSIQITVNKEGTNGDLFYNHFCGGNIILSDWVLTAAHCHAAEPFNQTSSLIVLAGADIITQADRSKTQIKSVNQIIRHENYDNKNFNNDIALLKLASKFTFGERLQPICVPSPSQTEYFSQKNKADCFVSGYGVSSSGSSLTRQLHGVNVPIIKNERCNELLGKSVTAQLALIGHQDENGRNLNNGPVFKETMVCAGYADGSRDACQGDSGGPLACIKKVTSAEEFQESTWYLNGIVSWGIGCGGYNRPGIYARVEHYRSWIWGKILEREEFYENPGGSLWMDIFWKV